MPPPPEEGIPAQWLPSWIRWPIRLLFFPFMILDRWMQGFAKWIVRPPLKRGGKCKRRGNCCYFILFKKNRGLMERLLTFWCTQVNGFYKRDKMPQKFDKKDWWVMGCRYLKKNGSCGNYFFRPSICRNWPVIEHFGHPQLLKGCGFTPVPRKKTKSPLNILD